MSGQRLVMVTLIGAGVIGAKMFLPRKSNPQERGDIAPETRDLSDKDPRYREIDTGGSKQNLPAGGVSSGRGGGGTTVSASEKLGFGGSILGGFGKKTLSRSDQEGYHDTRGVSRMGSEIPSKKHADVRE